MKHATLQAAPKASPPAEDLAWTHDRLDKPHDQADKPARVESMFTAIAPTYDLNNRVHSLGRDQAWRRAAVRSAGVIAGQTVLDVACGTGDLSLEFARAGAGRVIGVDFTVAMLRRATAKQRSGRPVTPTYHAADAMRLPLADACVDVVGIAFGIPQRRRTGASHSGVFSGLKTRRTVGDPRVYPPAMASGSAGLPVVFPPYPPANRDADLARSKWRLQVSAQERGHLYGSGRPIELLPPRKDSPIRQRSR